MPLTSDQVESLLKSEKENTIGVCAGDLKSEREKALDYYMGDMESDMPSVDGRSSAVSTDVSDTIEGLMPNLMEVFAATEEVVRFEPVGVEDEQAAEQESDYVNHVFMQKNPGFLVLYSFIKDALISKLGIVKVFWEESERQERETYRNQPDDVVALLAAQDDTEIIELKRVDDGYGNVVNDVELVTRKRYGCAKAVPVPPEEFGISKSARSLKDATYCYHEPAGKTQADLIAQGYDAEQIKSIQTREDESPEQQERSQGEGAWGDSKNEAMRPILVTEHYVRMAYEGDEPLLYRVTTGGQRGEILLRDGKPDIVPVDAMPFAVMSPIIMPHRIYGRSIADLVMDIQKIKTALVRSQLDNCYLLNNQRYEIAESHVHERTLDDLLSNSIGGVVRTKQPGGLIPIANQPIGNVILPMIEYLDATREWRTGVTRQGQGIDANALQNQTATAVNQVFMAAQARVKLIGRIFAETGIRDLFALLHATIRKNETQAQTVRLRNKWVQVDPRAWKNRYDMTINVGLGTGTRAEKIAHLSEMLKIQKEMMAGGAPTVTFKNIFNAAAALCKEAGFKSAEPFYTDPDSDAGQQIAARMAQKPNPHALEMQGRVQVEAVKAQAAAASDNAKLQAGIQTDQARMAAEFALKEKQMAMEFALREKQMAAEMALKEREMRLEAEMKERHGYYRPQGAGIEPVRMGGEVG